MAYLNNTFDASAIEPNQPLETLPPGRYTAHIINSEMRPTRSGSGQYLWLEMEVLEGQFKGRRIWDQLNLINPNAQTVEIAQRTLSAICRAVGQMQVEDSEQLHFKPLAVTLKVEPAGPDKTGVWRDARNRVSGYSAVNSASTPAPASAPAAAPAPRPANPAARPAGGAAAAPPARPSPPATPPWRRNG
jgi:hypothetical protein